MASKRKNILKAAKQQVKDRRDKMLNEMSSLIKDREKLEDRSSEEYIALSDNISELFNQIKQLDDVVSRKDKKSKNVGRFFMLDVTKKIGIEKRYKKNKKGTKCLIL